MSEEVKVVEVNAEASAASPSRPKRVLTAAEKEQILRERKKARLQDPSRLNYILGASSNLSSTPPAAPVHSSKPEPTPTDVSDTLTPTAPAESLLDDADGEPAVPSPSATQHAQHRHLPPTISPFHRSLLPTSDGPDMSDFLRQMASATQGSGTNPAGGIPGFPPATGGSGAALGSIGMMIGNMLWQKWQNSSSEAAPAPPSPAKIIHESIRILPWIVVACILALVASQPGSVVVNLPLSAVLLYTATSWIRPFAASSSTSTNPSITEKLMAPLNAWRWGWAQLQLFVFAFVLVFAALHQPG